MGRLLEMARQVPIYDTQTDTNASCSGTDTQFDGSKAALESQARHPFSPQEAMNHILDSVRLNGPLPHPKIVQLVVQAGWAKREVIEAIASLQRQGIIEHDLNNGYILSAK
jgi:hypothetical protein